jgi:hypothetical protein
MAVRKALTFTTSFIAKPGLSRALSSSLVTKEQAVHICNVPKLPKSYDARLPNGGCDHDFPSEIGETPRAHSQTGFS